MSLISLDIHVDRLSDVLAIFDRIEVWRSTVGTGGPYEEISDVAGPTSAQIDGTNAGPFVLNGLVLDLIVDSVSVPVTFAGIDPFDLASVISQINSVVPGVASEVPSNTDRLRIASTTTGTGSSVLVASNPAATALGLPTAQINGKGSRITLAGAQTDYQFLDLDGLDAYFYQTRYSSTTSPTVSSFSDPRQGSAGVVAPGTELIKAELSLLDGAGKPVVGRCVRFILQAAQAVDTTAYQAIPGVDANVSITTTESGYAFINLLKGATYRMIIEGTSFIREFVVPDTGPFDVLLLAGTAPDPFDIVKAAPRPIKVTI